jgi:hypothetical protein
LACSNSSAEYDNLQTPELSPDEGFSYPVPLADFTDAAEQLLDLSPNGIAIGEVHGQLASIMLLEAMTDTVVKRGKKVLILHEFTPTEAGLDIDDSPMDTVRNVDLTSKDLPLWTDNFDKRATWELHAFFEKIAIMPNVELSHLWDGRLNPPPNLLKAHGFAERWKVAQAARPQSYIIAMGGNYHTSSPIKLYDLEVTNSMCRYADERLDIQITCITVDNWDSPNEDCKQGQKAIVLKGKDVFEHWDYVVRRPDRCVVQAHWVNAPK